MVYSTRNILIDIKISFEIDGTYNGNMFNIYIRNEVILF